MTCKVIETGSKGNAVVLDGNILLDCGVPFRALKESCKQLGLVVLTHIHGDHFAPETIKRLALLRPSLRFLCPPWLRAPLLSMGIRENVIDVGGKGYSLTYGRLPGGSCDTISFSMTPIPHDVLNCAWHICGRSAGRSERVFYATDCASLASVEAVGYDLYLIEANYGEDEIQARMQQKLEAGSYAYELRAMESHLSKEQAEMWLGENAREGVSKVLYLHQHQGASQK